MINEQLASLPERWVELEEFPGYEVSDRGRVRRMGSERIVAVSTKPGGLTMVGLLRWSDQKNRNVQHKRSLPLLVACAFVKNPNPETFDTPINLDGDRKNNHWMNLAWRPMWFARKFMQQFRNDPVLDEAIEDVETRIQYQNSRYAAMQHGLLEQDIVVSMHNNTYVWPTGQIFRRA